MENVETNYILDNKKITLKIEEIGKSLPNSKILFEVKVTRCNRLNIRTRPETSYNSKIIGCAIKGDTFSISDVRWDNEHIWGKIADDENEDCWICLNYCERVSWILI